MRGSFYLGAALLLASKLGGQQKAAPIATPLLIDLAARSGELGAEAVTPADSFRLRGFNLTPRRNREGLYVISVSVNDESIAPFSRDDFRVSPAPRTEAQDSTAAEDAQPSCDLLKKAYSALDATDDEKEVPGAVANLESAIKVSTGPSCVALVHAAEALKAQTEASWSLPGIGRGQRMTVQLKTARSGAAERAWTKTYLTGVRGEWRAMYAFAFIVRIVDAPRFFTEEVPTGFRITRQERRDWADFVPAIFFSWKPGNALGSDWTHGFTGGLGFDLTAPVVFLGWSMTFNENIMWTSGLAMHRQEVLLGRYREGDIITTNLDESQLHSPSYRPNVYFAVAFRFGANPFSPGAP